MAIPFRINLIPGDWAELERKLNYLTRWIASQPLTSGASPTFTGLTLTGLTATRLVQTDSLKALTSVANLQSWIAGTTNQVTVTDDTDGTVTLSLPQNIHTGASPTFAGLTLSGLTINRIPFVSTGGLLIDKSNFTYITSTDIFTLNTGHISVTGAVGAASTAATDVLVIAGGNGGAGTGLNSGGKGSDISITTGGGGSAAGGTAGSGGDIVLVAGNGGASSGAGGGLGGLISFTSGTGGTAPGGGKNGGAMTFTAGEGGSGIGGPGNGGVTTMSAGKGGNRSFAGIAGTGGSFSLTGGPGGNNTLVDNNCDGGVGGSATFVGGTGGNGSPTGAGSNGGAGGSIFLYGGAGGTGFTAGTPGNIVLASTSAGTITGKVGFGVVLPLTQYHFKGTGGGSDVIRIHSGFVSEDPVVLFQRSGSLGISCANTGCPTTLELFTFDGDTTDNVNINIFGLGVRATSITNYELMQVGYFTGSPPVCRISSTAAGSGTVRDLQLFTGANTGQLNLTSNGNVSIANSLRVGSNVDPTVELDVTGTTQTDDLITKNPLVDVRYFGAVGNGVADDTTAIQDAIDYIEGLSPAAGLSPILYFPAGKSFLITASLIVSPSTAQGYCIEGYGAKILNHVAADAAIKVGDGVTRVGTFKIKGLCIDGDSSIGYDGIIFNDVGTLSIEDLLVLGHSNNGIEFQGLNLLIELINCQSEDNANIQLYASSIDDNNAFKVIGGHYKGGVSGIKFNKVQNAYINTTMEYSSGYGLTVLGGSQATDIVLENCWFENEAGDSGAINIEGIIRNVIIRGCLFENVNGYMLFSTSTNTHAIHFINNSFLNVDVDCFQFPTNCTAITWENNHFPNKIIVPDVQGLHDLERQIPLQSQTDSVNGATIPEITGNLILNGDFTFGFTYFQANGTVTPTIDTSTYVSTPQSLKMICDGSAGYKGLLSSQNYSLPRHCWYGTFSCYAKGDSLSDVAKLEISTFGSAASQAAHFLQFPSGTWDWKRFSVTVKFDQSWTWPLLLHTLRTYLPVTGTLWLDDIQFSPNNALGEVQRFAIDHDTGKFYFPKLAGFDTTDAPTFASLTLSKAVETYLKFVITDTTSFTNFNFFESATPYGGFQYIGSTFADAARRQAIELWSNGGHIILNPQAVSKNVGISKTVPYSPTELLDVNGNAIVNGTLEVTGLSTLTGGLLIDSDSNKATLGAGSDMTIWYDGTNGNVKTSDIAASDLDITCGANKTVELQNHVYRDINLSGAILSVVEITQLRDEFVDEAGADTGIETWALGVGDGVQGSFEIQHDYAEGTDLRFHVHWQGIAAPTGTDNVQWQLTYTVSREETTLDAVTVIAVETAFDTQYEFKRSNFAVITGTNFQIGDQFLFRLERIAASVDEYAGDALLATVGIHYEVNTMGSRQLSTK